MAQFTNSMGFKINDGVFVTTPNTFNVKKITKSQRKEIMNKLNRKVERVEKEIIEIKEILKQMI